MSETLSVATSPTQSIEGRRIAGGEGALELERHYTPAEIGTLWGFDQTTIRRMFIDEPGVLKEGKRARRDGKRQYVSLRIPESVAVRVHQRKAR
jgi:hypothetical protein